MDMLVIDTDWTNGEGWQSLEHSLAETKTTWKPILGHRPLIFLGHWHAPQKKIVGLFGRNHASAGKLSWCETSTSEAVLQTTSLTMQWSQVKSQPKGDSSHDIQGIEG